MRGNRSQPTALLQSAQLQRRAMAHPPADESGPFLGIHAVVQPVPADKSWPRRNPIREPLRCAPDLYGLSDHRTRLTRSGCRNAPAAHYLPRPRLSRASSSGDAARSRETIRCRATAGLARTCDHGISPDEHLPHGTGPGRIGRRRSAARARRTARCASSTRRSFRESSRATPMRRPSWSPRKAPR